MIALPKPTYEKEITFAIRIPKSSRLNWSRRIPLWCLSGTGWSWHILETREQSEPAKELYTTRRIKKLRLTKFH
jgi:hypothetical protein